VVAVALRRGVVTLYAELEAGLGDSEGQNEVLPAAVARVVPYKTVLLDMEMVTGIDSTGMAALELTIGELRAKEITVLLVACRGTVRRQMHRSDFYKRVLSLEHFCITLDEVSHGSRTARIRDVHALSPFMLVLCIASLAL
jgi:anti-anti-sigma regulatory factor